MGPAPSAVALIDALSACGRVLLTGPVDPDGDSIGACLALQRVLRRRGVQADVTGDPAWRYAWMPGAAEMLPDEGLAPDWDAVVVLDGDRHRLPPAATGAFEAALVRGIVDHHASTTPDGYTHAWVDPAATSTCEMLYDWLEATGEPLDPELAAAIYTGAIFDTGAFRYSNTTAATHRMAARLLEVGIDHAAICMRVLMERRLSGLRNAAQVFAAARFVREGSVATGRVSLADREDFGLLAGDLEGLVDALVHVHGVEVAALLVEHDPGTVKASLRSRGAVNVAEVARGLATTGGGHAKAAGATLRASLDAAEEIVHGALGAALDARIPLEAT